MEWISVKDRLPITPFYEQSDYVMVWIEKYKDFYKAFYCSDGYWTKDDNDTILDGVTHWAIIVSPDQK